MNKNSPQAASRSTKAARSGRRSTKKAVKPVAKARRTAKTAVRKSSGITKPAANIVATQTTRTVGMAIGTLRTPSPPMQPAFAADLPASRHKYQVGQAVYYTSPSFGRAAANGSYTIVKLLPSDGDDCQYRIKSSGEAFERVAKESQLEQA